jgi:metal-responsive CopG/Arc/MetJ family transcriptional regulator
MIKKTISISLTKVLIELIDKKRNLVSRSAFIAFILKKVLEEENGEDKS